MRCQCRSTAAAAITSTSCSRFGMRQYPKRSDTFRAPGESARTIATAGASSSLAPLLIEPPAFLQPLATLASGATNTSTDEMSW